MELRYFIFFVKIVSQALELQKAVKEFKLERISGDLYVKNCKGIHGQIMTKGNHDHCIRKLIKTGYWTFSVLHYFTLNLNFDLKWNSEEVQYPVFTNFLIQWWIHSREGREWQRWLAVINWLATRLKWCPFWRKKLFCVAHFLIWFTDFSLNKCFVKNFVPSEGHCIIIYTSTHEPHWPYQRL